MTIKLKIHDFWSSDVPSIKSWVPEDDSCIYIQLSIAIGLEGEVSADNYQLIIATPSGIKEWIDEFNLDLIMDRNIMIFRRFSWKEIEKNIQDIVKKCESENLTESVLKLQRYFLWEYEDYSVE